MYRRSFSALLAVFLCFSLSSQVPAADSGPMSLLTDRPVASHESWTTKDVRGIDHVNDVPRGLEGADLLSFYFSEKGDELAFRVSMVQMKNPATGEELFERDQPMIVVLFDYATGGTRDLPGGIEGKSGITWDEAVMLDAFGGGDNKARVFQSLNSNGPDDPGLHKAILDRIPAGRWGTPEDLQGVAVFLASSAADYMQGYTIAVDGGWLAR